MSDFASVQPGGEGQRSILGPSRFTPRERQSTVRERALPSIPHATMPASGVAPLDSPSTTNPFVPSSYVPIRQSSSPPRAFPPLDSRDPNVEAEAHTYSSYASPSTSRFMNPVPNAGARTVEGSYMVLQPHVEADPQDSVTLFLNTIDTMLDQFDRPLALPVAFATAPLSPKSTPTAVVPLRTSNPSFPPIPSTSKPPINRAAMDLDDEDSDDSFFIISSSPSSSIASLTSVPDLQHKYPPVSSSNLGSPRHQQSPRGSSNSRSRTRPLEDDTSTRLREENEALKAQVQELAAKLERTDAIVKAQSQKEIAMRDSVLVLKRQSQKLAASTNLPSRSPAKFGPNPFQGFTPSPIIPEESSQPSLPPNLSPAPSHRRHNSDLTLNAFSNTPNPFSNSPGTPTPPAIPSRIPVLDPSLDVVSLGRIKDLEAQVQALRIENDNQRTQISKYRERWAKLKESAKRKQSQKAAQHSMEE